MAPTLHKQNLQIFAQRHDKTCPQDTFLLMTVTHGTLCSYIWILTILSPKYIMHREEKFIESKS